MDATIDGAEVRTYRGDSLAALAPQIRAELGERAVIVRQREGVTGGIGGFFGKRCVEVDVAVVGGRPPAAAPAKAPGGFDVTDDSPAGPAPAIDLGPARLPQAAAGLGANAAPAAESAPEFVPEFPAAPAATPATQPAPAPAPSSFSALLRAADPAAAEPQAAPQRTHFEPLEAAQQVAARVRGAAAYARDQAEATAPVAPRPTVEKPAMPAPMLVPDGHEGKQAAQVAQLRETMVARGLPEPIVEALLDAALRHRMPLRPEATLEQLVIAELSRVIGTAPISGREGQAIAIVGSGGAGKTRAVARLAAAYAAAGTMPVACVTLGDAGDDHQLAKALAPFGVEVHEAPDAPRAMDRVTALRERGLVLIDTPAISPADPAAIADFGAVLDLLELDQVSLCLPVTLAAGIGRRVLRALLPLGIGSLVATHADEVDLLGGVVAVSIDRRIPLSYVSAGTGRGTIVDAEAGEIARRLVQA